MLEGKDRRIIRPGNILTGSVDVMFHCGGPGTPGNNETAYHGDPTAIKGELVNPEECASCFNKDICNPEVFHQPIK